MASPTLPEDEIDDLLYFARTNDTSELQTLLISLAAQNSCSEADILLTARDADSGNTIAHYAAANGFDDLLKWLLTISRPAAMTSTTSNGEAPEPAPSSTTKPPPPALFTTANAAGSTPLHYAATTGALACATVLVEAGVDVKARNNMGHTPVYEAEVAEKQEIVGYLLKEGTVEEEEGENSGGLPEVEGQEKGVEDGVEGLNIEEGEKGEGKVEDG